MIARGALFEKFVGREEELAFLVDARERAARESRGRLVLVRGEAGIGKSRLIEEFERATARNRGAFVRVRCYESGARPFAAFSDILDALARVREIGASRVSESRSAVTGIEGSLAPAKRLDLASRIATLRTFFDGAAPRCGSITLVADDLHWSDLATLAAIAMLAELVRTTPIVFVGTLRDDDLMVDPQRASAVGKIERLGVDRISLGALGERDVEASLRAILRDSDHATVRKIADLAEGNPYIAEELARNVVLHGGKADAEPVTTLRGAVLERADRLSPEARAILVKAAVLGRSVRMDDVAIVTESSDPDALVRCIRSARDLQLITEVETAGDVGFRFRHALTRDTLYRELTTIERRSLHRAIAEAIERAGDPRRIGEVAHHYWFSGDVERARAWNERAGDAAVAVAAVADACEPYERAAKDLSTTDARFARITFKLLEALVSTARHADTRAAVDAALRAFDSTGDWVSAVRTHVAFAKYAVSQSPALAETHIRAAASKMRDGAPRELEYELAFLRGRFAINGRRDVAEATAAFRRAERFADSDRQKLASYTARGGIANFCGRLSEARTIYEESARLSRDGTQDRIYALSLHCLADIEFQAGASAKAREIIDEATRAWERAGSPGDALKTRGLAASYAAYAGDFAAARKLTAIYHAEEIDRDPAFVAARFLLMRAQGLPDEAERFVAPFLARIESTIAHLVIAIGVHVPWILRADRARASEVIRRVVEITSDDDLSPVAYAAVTFGDEATAANVVSRLEALPPVAEPHFRKDVDVLLFRSALAQRQHRRLDAVGFARDALRILEGSPHWLERSHALLLAGEREAAFELFAAVGATSECARLGAGEARLAEQSAPALTRREEQVARLIASGLSSREAGERLGISARTVETHVAKTLEKLGLRSRSGLLEALGDAIGEGSA